MLFLVPLSLPVLYYLDQGEVRVKSTVYTRVLVDLAYKPTPLFVVNFQVFKVYRNLANPAIFSYMLEYSKLPVLHFHDALIE